MVFPGHIPFAAACTMFNICRRGPASIARVVRTATAPSSISIRSPALPFASRLTVRPPVQARCLSLSLSWRNRQEEHGQPRAQVSERAREEDDGADAFDVEEPIATKFEELRTRQLVHPILVNQLVKGMALHTMTPVQSKTINKALQGTDM